MRPAYAVPSAFLADAVTAAGERASAREREIAGAERVRVFWASSIADFIAASRISAAGLGLGG